MYEHICKLLFNGNTTPAGNIIVASFYDDNTATLAYVGEEQTKADVAMANLEVEGDGGSHVMVRK